jgi:peptidyl-prolyl cis-trans isomerase B (cyclophilin B)
MAKEAVTKQATIDTNRGTIIADLYETDAPITVGNFEKLANGGYYDGVKFHRVVPKFVIQGGDPLSRDLPTGDPRIGTGGPGYHIKCETKGNPRTHDVGALSMAHAGKDTGGSQFFIVLDEGNTRHLNGVHTVFGKVVRGGDVVTQIRSNDVMVKVRVA